MSSLVLLSLVNFGLIKLILVEFGFGKADGLVKFSFFFLVSLIKADVTNKQTHNLFKF